MKKHDKIIFDKLLALVSTNHINKIAMILLFGGSGIYFNQIMFSWIYDNKLYLKGYSVYLAMFVRYKMQPMEFNSGIRSKLLQYYQVTDYLWQEEIKLRKILQLVIKYIVTVNKTCRHS